MAVASSALRELAGLGIGVTSLNISRHDDVVAEGHVVVAHGLALDREADQAVGLREIAARRSVEAELHAVLPGRNGS